jgi:putative ABC transport system permease protein
MLTILAIAASVTLATGLEMASRSAQEQLARTADALIGSAKIEVVAGSVGIPESLLETVRGVPGVGAVSPMITATLRVPGHDLALEVVGVDFLAQEEVRPATISARGVRVRDPLRVLALPNAVIVTRKLIERLGLSPAATSAGTSTIAARFAGRELTLSVQGILEPGGLAEAYGGQVAAMDVYALQQLIGRRGWFDRLDVVPEPDRDVDDLIAQIGARIRGAAEARRSAFQTRDNEQMLAAIRRVVLLFTVMVTVVASLLTYGAMTLFAELQRRQLFVLRAAGMEAARARSGLLVDVLALASLGALAGWIGGLLVAQPLVRALSLFLSENLGEEIRTLRVGTGTIGVALFSGLFAGVVGGLAAARRVGRRFLLDTLEQATSEPASSRLALLLGGICLVAATVAFASSMQPLIRVTIVFAGGVGSLAALARARPDLARLLAAPLRPMAPSIGHLAGRSFMAAPGTFAIVLTAIAAPTAAITGLHLVTESTAQSLVSWATAFSSGATSIRAGAAVGFAGREIIASSTLDLIRSTPGVLAVNENFSQSYFILFRGEEVSLAASRMDVVIEYGRLAAVDRPYRELATALAAGAVAVSTGFSRRFDVKLGDRLTIDTPAGAREFEVAGLIRDYRLPAGTILMDTRTFDAHWPRPDTWSVSIWTTEPREEVFAAIEARVAGLQDLFFVDGTTLAAAQRRFIDRFVGPLNVLGALTAVLSGVSVAVVLLAAVARRRREFAILRASGAEPRHVAAVIFVDGIVVTVLGLVVGLALGYASAPPMTDVLRVTSGWDVEQIWFSPAVPVVALGAFGVALAAAVLPSRVAFRALPREVLAPE